MLQTLLILQIFIVLILIVVILLQRTSSDGFTSMAGSMGNILSQRSTGNFLVKVTIVLVFAFMANSIVLARIVVQQTASEEKAANISALEEESNKLDLENQIAKKESE